MAQSSSNNLVTSSVVAISADFKLSAKPPHLKQPASDVKTKETEALSKMKDDAKRIKLLINIVRRLHSNVVKNKNTYPKRIFFRQENDFFKVIHFFINSTISNDIFVAALMYVERFSPAGIHENEVVGLFVTAVDYVTTIKSIKRNADEELAKLVTPEGRKEFALVLSKDNYIDKTALAQMYKALEQLNSKEDPSLDEENFYGLNIIEMQMLIMEKLKKIGGVVSAACLNSYLNTVPNLGTHAIHWLEGSEIQYVGSMDFLKTPDAKDTKRPTAVKQNSADEKILAGYIQKIKHYAKKETLKHMFTSLIEFEPEVLIGALIYLEKLNLPFSDFIFSVALTLANKQWCDSPFSAFTFFNFMCKNRFASLDALKACPDYYRHYNLFLKMEMNILQQLNFQLHITADEFKNFIKKYFLENNFLETDHPFFAKEVSVMEDEAIKLGEQWMQTFKNPDEKDHRPKELILSVIRGMALTGRTVLAAGILIERYREEQPTEVITIECTRLFIQALWVAAFYYDLGFPKMINEPLDAKLSKDASFPLFIDKTDYESYRAKFAFYAQIASGEVLDRHAADFIKDIRYNRIVWTPKLMNEVYADRGANIFIEEATFERFKSKLVKPPSPIRAIS